MFRRFALAQECDIRASRSLSPATGINQPTQSDFTFGAVSLNIKLITAGPRPASVFHRGGEVLIHVHDAWHLKVRRGYLVDIQMFHPDTAQYHAKRRNSRPQRMRGDALSNLLRSYKTWLRQEQAWYQNFGLRVPSIKHMVAPPVTPSAWATHNKLRMPFFTNNKRLRFEFTSSVI